jgi:uncharacterized protein YndB with AHSA1/START domain
VVERSIVVAVPRAHAFRVWTEQVGLWWPPGHRLSKDPSATFRLEARPGGRLYERTDDGREHDYGRVLAIEPPVRLRLAWFLGSGSEHPTEVQITFHEVAQGTRVHVEHVRGDCPRERFDAIVEIFERSWATVTAAYAAHLQEEP